MGDAVAEQASNAVGLFEDGDPVAGAAELLGGSETSGPGAYDGDAFTGADGGRFGDDPAFGEGAIDDGALDGLDGDRRFVDAENASGFARGGADASGEFGEVVGRVEDAHRFLPAAFEDEVVEVRDDVGQRTAGVAE